MLWPGFGPLRGSLVIKGFSFIRQRRCKGSIIVHHRGRGLANLATGRQKELRD